MPGLGPVFLLQIVHVDAPHHVVVSRFQAGGQMEANLAEAVIDATLAKGVGLGRTEAHVADAMRAAFNEVLTDLKEQTRGLVPAMMKIPPKSKPIK